MKFADLKLSTKLLIWFLSIGLIPFTLTGIILSVNVENVLSRQTINHLKSIRDTKKMSILRFLDNQRTNASTLATIGNVITAAEMMDEALHLMGGTIKDNAIWKALFNRYIPAMQKYAYAYGYQDLYIISTDGDIVFSVAQKSDLGKNIYNPSLVNTPLGKCFTKAMQTGLSLTDVGLYPPHNNDPVAFIGSAIKRDDRIVGVIALYIPIELINKIMTVQSGLGDTGEVYLVGQDLHMRSDSWLDPRNRSVKSSLSSSKSGLVDTSASHAALVENRTGEMIIDNYAGDKVVSAFCPVDAGDFRWALIAEIDKRDAFEPATIIKYIIMLTSLAGVVVVISVSFLTSHRISEPLKKLTEISQQISQGKLEAPFDSTLIRSKDEIGNLATAFFTMTEKLKSTMSHLTDEIAQRKRLIDIIDSTSDMVSAANPEGVITYMNRAGKEMIGWDGQDMLNRRIAEAHPKWAADLIHDTAIPFALENKVWTGETALLNAQGTIIPTSQVIMAHRSEQGELEFLSTIIRDISVIKKAQAAISESEERFRKILEASPDPIVICEMDTTIIFTNPAFNRIFNWTPDECEGQKIIFIPDQEKEVYTSVFENLFNGDSVTGKETRALTKSGEIIPIRLSAAAYNDNQGRPIGMFLNLRDIRQQKKLEQQFQQSQKMESIGTLAGGIAHDFNNLLTGIQGRVSLMMHGDPLTSKQKEQVLSIEHYVRSASELTGQLLGFARGGKYQSVSTDINELLRHSIDMFGRTTKELTVHAKFDKYIDPVEVDQGQINQVLLNILVNAWQAMPNGGDLYISTHKVMLDEQDVSFVDIKPGEYTKISITDTGIGMDEETQKRIFDPFYTTKGMGKGTGLGLASAYGIIKNHHGRITVYSKKGQGATFNIYLPSTERPVEKEDSKMDNHILLGSETILLVDDEEMIIDIGEQLLQNLGYSVIIAHSGQQAIDIYSKQSDQIDLVILDMVMPGMDGELTFDHLKKLDDNIKVLLSSGYSMNGKATQIMKKGCNAFIQKPFNLVDLSIKIRQILDESFA